MLFTRPCAFCACLAALGASQALALDITCTSDAPTLRDALLAQPPPTGVTITSVTTIPSGPQCPDAMGTFTGFNLSDGTSSLSLPDGIVLTTGDVRRPDNSQIDSNLEIGFCVLVLHFTLNQDSVSSKGFSHPAAATLGQVRGGAFRKDVAKNRFCTCMREKVGVYS